MQKCGEIISSVEGELKKEEKHARSLETLKSSHRVYNLITSRHFKAELTFTCLAECPEHIPLLARWGEDKWGYLRRFPGYEVREQILCEKKSNFYVGFFAGQPVAMFMLKDLEAAQKCKKNADEKYQKSYQQFICSTRSQYLLYVYVDENYRGCGFGKQLMLEAKKRAKEGGADYITFSTLTPTLNQFYTQEEIGAAVVHETMDYITHAGKNYAYPAEYLAIKL